MVTAARPWPVTEFKCVVRMPACELLRACRDLGAGSQGDGGGAGASGGGGDDDEGGTGGGGGGDDEGGTGGGGGTGSEDTGGDAMTELTAAAAAIDVSDTAGPDSTTGSAAAGSAGLAMPVLPPMCLASLDLQPSWEPYVLALPGVRSTSQYSFAQWNIKESVDAVTRSGCPVRATGFQPAPQRAPQLACRQA